jgi:sarcosine oxidase subunit alpha
MDEKPLAGGSLLWTRGEQINGRPASEWVESTIQNSLAEEEFTYLPRTTVFGSYDSNYLVAVERRTDHLDVRPAKAVSRERIWHVRAKQVILATGSIERNLIFANNDRPGVMLASAARTYLNQYAVVVGEDIVIATTNDSAYELARDLHAAGERVPLIVDSRESATSFAKSVIEATGANVHFSSAVVDTGANEHGQVSSVKISKIDSNDTPVGQVTEVKADVVAVSGGWSPMLHLFSQRNRQLLWNEHLAAFGPGKAIPNQTTVGACNADLSLAEALRAGAEAGAKAATKAGFNITPIVPQADEVEIAPNKPLWVVQGVTENGLSEDWSNHFVDLHRDQTVKDAWRAVGAGMRSLEHVKRYTSIGTGDEQAKINTLALNGVIAAAIGVKDVGSIGITMFRAPYTPVGFAALAGRERGALFDPARLTSIHSWHVEHGALFEDVGQWKRPWYYPKPGEDMHAAVWRECAAVRESVGFMDASTLGKIEIRGKDAGEFLNRIYTNAFKKLAIGSARYGVMCKPDGMVFDDGVTLRLDEERFYMTTTTSGAAKVLDWLEEWSQTEWPELDVVCTSVTEQWSTVAVVGPKSRAVIGKLFPDLDVSNEAFPFMAFHEATMKSGVKARVARISFSGELAFEINTEAWYGLHVWKEVFEAGQEFNITPYGTETMHVLRAEKGFIIVGQDTDGTVTPQDAGMDWVVSKVKPFIGHRSFKRADTAREDRNHLVGLLPVDRKTFFAEGSQLVKAGASVDTSNGPVPMEGYVTSAYPSPALGSPFGLALVNNGRNRFGEILQIPNGSELIDVEITSPVLFDSEGSRRDG